MQLYTVAVSETSWRRNHFNAFATNAQASQITFQRCLLIAQLTVVIGMQKLTTGTLIEMWTLGLNSIVSGLFQCLQTCKLNTLGTLVYRGNTTLTRQSASHKGDGVITL